MKSQSILLLFILFISACQHGESIQNNEPISKKVKEVDAIFENSTRNKTISKDELKRSIKIYLDAQNELLFQDKVIEQLSQNKINQKYKNKIKNIILLSNKNDKNFREYIENNKLPNEYKDDVIRISNYISGSNKITISINEEIEKQIKQISKGDFNINNFIPKNINGKEQKKIEEFLEKESIETDAFNK
ncbi:NDxxF motif lipoprotein [Macrococcus animalis]|uniref:NDxxF motif lipoprotein n=1 Tax=Macrococcus animalis TaxID=3395467 RepID=UPI0039BE46C1